ncbi:hypothetical protein ACHHYP_02663 [Achlya hypogyna]|uniref:Phospholipid/glycerol acyltransferase domain-containing protein n=1 Tax=Achlya hypogyna TaxID=1202772 RepID=A0A1V9Z5W2_ACHHY|nr:hypothetical protein ACHHYP_02663 [Achlya hypogyna]
MAAVDYSQTALYRFLYTCVFPVLAALFAWSVQGQEHLPKDKSKRILFIGYHTTHNWDLLLTGMSLKDALDGESPIGLMHRTLVTVHPWLRQLGCIQGTKANAMNMYNSGHRACMVIPGGAEEAIAGFENAYTVNWKSSSGRVRTGFAELAIDADAVIIPVVIQNAQEMYFNPVFFLMNITGISRAYDALLAMPYGVGWLFLQLKFVLWITVTFLASIPMPVKSTLKIGVPVAPEANETPAALAQRAASAYEAFLHRADRLPRDPDKKILFIGYHSNHNWDIMMMGMGIKDALGEVPIGLIHRGIIACHPWLRWMGCIPGTRADALAAYAAGHRACVVIPGGAEEAVAGFENAYKVDWKSTSGRARTGFAELAIEADAVVVPVVVQNLQEMCFNPIFYLCNVTGISRGYDVLMRLPYGIGWLFWQLKGVLWLTLNCGTSIPLPVRATLQLGPALRQKRGETAANFAKRVERKYAQLLARANPGGLNYSRALRQRFVRSSKSV